VRRSIVGLPSPRVVEAAAEGTPDNLRQRAATWARQNPGMPVTKRELMRIPQHSARPRSRHRHAHRVDPTPARLRSLSRCCRLYDLPCSGAYSAGPRRVSPVAQRVLCHPAVDNHPAGVTARPSQIASPSCCLRSVIESSASRATKFRDTSRSLALQPSDSLPSCDGICRSASESRSLSILLPKLRGSDS
jgi:hypothetical protein